MEMVKAVVRQLAYCPFLVYVDSPNIQVSLQETLGLKVYLTEGESSAADVAVFPFSIGEASIPNGEATIVIACENPFSYKSLIYPKQITATIHHQLRLLKNDYRLTPTASLYSPRFMFWWTLAKAVDALNSAWYFRLEDHSMRRLIEIGPQWRLSYLAVFVGRRTQ
jgi:hypothetical protein